MASVRRKRVFWTAQDLRMLRRLAGRHRVGRIARQLGRTVLAVRFKAHTHGISLAVKRAR